MDLKVIVSLGLLAIVGFLFYPRSGGQKAPMVEYESEWIDIKETLKDEPLHGAKLHKDNPVVETYNLGYIYKIDRAEIHFSEAPKNYDILGSTIKNAQKYDRLTSRYEYYPVVSLPPKEARWVQVVINDWSRTQPSIESTRIAARYSRHSQIRSVRTKYNPDAAFMLIDSLKKQNAPKWIGGKRVEKEVQKDNKTVKEVTYGSPGKDGVEIVFDLGIAKRVYGTAVTTGGQALEKGSSEGGTSASVDENNLKQYQISTSVDGKNFQQVYLSGELGNETITDSHIFADPVQARYLRLAISPDGWYGKYAEIREVEVYTGEFRPSDYAEPIEEHNAIQVYYDNCGTGGNAQAPDVIQGFPFDRGEDADSGERYFLKPGEEVDAKNSPSQRSYCYHYDTIILSYSNLESEAMYWVQVTYLQEKNGSRIQNLTVDGFLLHDEMNVTADIAEKFTFAIPPEAYADGEMELHFNRLAGPNAVVSEVSILQANREDMMVRADLGAPEVITNAPAAIGARGGTTVVIDGLLDEWPLLFPLVPPQYSRDPFNSPCQMYVQWDSEDLFIAFRASKDRLRSQASGSLSKTGVPAPAAADSSDLMRSPDTLHIFVDTTLTRSPGMYRTGDHHFRLSPLGVPASEKKMLAAQIHHHLDAIPRTIIDNKEIQVAFSRPSGTSEYSLEARIPKDKALYDFVPQSGGVIGFNYILSNPYSEDLAWSAVNTNAPPASWGKLELVGTVRGQLAIIPLDPFMVRPDPELLASRPTSFSAGETLALAVWDPDRNTDRNSSQSVKVRISGDLTKDSKELTLHEAAASAGFPPANNSDLFVGKLDTEFGTTPAEDPLVLVVQGKEQVTMSYVDPYYGPNESNVEVTYTANVRVGTTGTIEIVSQSGEKVEAFNAGERLFLKVEDGDLAQGEQEAGTAPEIVVTASSSEDTEKVTLQASGKSLSETGNTGTSAPGGVFIGSIETAYGTQGAADGILQVSGTERIKALYQDSIQATGNTNVPVEDYAIVNIGSTGMLIVGESGTGNVYDTARLEDFNAGDDLLIFLIDADNNKDAAVAEKVDVTVAGNAVQDSVLLPLTETEPDSNTFSSVLRTEYSMIADGSNETLEVRGSETITVTYNDALQANGATNVAVSVKVVVNTGSDGTVSILKANYFWDLENFNAGDILYFKVDDADLNVNSGAIDQMEISVVSEETHDEETVVLKERNPDAGVFYGSLTTEYYQSADVPSASITFNNTLQVQGGEKVTAIYLDKLRATGETKVPVIDSCKVDVGTTGRITVYSKANPYTPIAGFPDEGWKSKFRAGETLIIKLEDMDLNLSSASAEIFQVTTTEDSIRDIVSVILTEVTGSAGVFTGEVKTEYGEKAIPGDGILQVQGEGRIDVFYKDAITGTGQTDVSIGASLTVETGEIGTIQAIRADGRNVISSFSADDAFIVRVQDGDLNADPETEERATVMVRGNLLEDQLQVILQETDLNSGIFVGSVQSAYGSQADLRDEKLQVREKEVITLTYIDEVSPTGETNTPISIELIVRSGSAGSLLIVDENWRELPNFNPGRRLYLRLDDFVLSNTSPGAAASVIVQGDLTKDTEEVLLEEMPGEQGIYIGSISTNYGTTPVQDGLLQVRGGEEVKAIYYPQTPGSPSEPIIDTTYTNKGNTAKVTIAGENGLKLTNFNAGDTLYLRLEDFDLNLDTFAMDTADIWIVGDVIAGGKTITLSETSEDSGVFTGSIDTKYGRGVFESTSILEVVGGEQVTAVYYDALTASGETDVKVTDSCRANMLGTAPYASRGVVIDGSLAEWPLENALRAGDEGSNVYVQWDKDNLYILAYVIDSDVVVPDATQFWDGADALEIHIDTDPTGEISSYLRGLKKPSYYFFWICPKGAGPEGNRPYVGQNMPETVYDYTAIETAVRIFSNRYVLEARIPLDPVLGGFDPYITSKANRIGFNYIIRRSNAPQLRWAIGTENEPNLPPSFFGTLILKQT